MQLGTYDGGAIINHHQLRMHVDHQTARAPQLLRIGARLEVVFKAVRDFVLILSSKRGEEEKIVLWMSTAAGLEKGVADSSVHHRHRSPLQEDVRFQQIFLLCSFTFVQM